MRDVGKPVFTFRISQGKGCGNNFCRTVLNRTICIHQYFLLLKTGVPSNFMLTTYYDKTSRLNLVTSMEAIIEYTCSGSPTDGWIPLGTVIWYKTLSRNRDEMWRDVSEPDGVPWVAWMTCLGVMRDWLSSWTKQWMFYTNSITRTICTWLSWVLFC